MIKPGDLKGHKALLRSEKVAESSAKQFLKSAKTPVVEKLTKGDSRGPGKHHKGFYN